MPKKINNITKEIMDKIHGDKIKMKPRAYFIVGSILTFIGLISSVVISMFLVGLTRFSFRAHGPMAEYRLGQILANFPWWAPVFAIIGLGLGIWILLRYDFPFKANIKLIVAGFIIAISFGGWIVDSIGLNDVLLRRGPIEGMMRHYFKDNNLDGFRDGQGRGYNRIYKLED